MEGADDLWTREGLSVLPGCVNLEGSKDHSCRAVQAHSSQGGAAEQRLEVMDLGDISTWKSWQRSLGGIKKEKMGS